jgi:anti-anti-sigma regulatory factor
MTKPERPRGSVLHLEGEFDLAAARMLEASLNGIGRGGRLEIDFSRVRHFHDLGIATLARALEKLDGRSVKLGGLSAHQVRLLRYFGVDADLLRSERPASRKR